MMGVSSLFLVPCSFLDSTTNNDINIVRVVSPGVRHRVRVDVRLLLSSRGTPSVTLLRSQQLELPPFRLGPFSGRR